MAKEGQKPISSRGGPRPNSGRIPGSKNKISAKAILAEIEQRDVPFEQGLAEDYIRARRGDDLNIIVKYQQMLLNKVIADKTELDVTSGGEPFKAIFTFQPVELPDWRSAPTNDKH